MSALRLKWANWKVTALIAAQLHRWWPLVVLALCVLVLVAVMWIPALRDASIAREQKAGDALRQLQTDLAEIDKLKQGKPPQSPTSPDLQKVLAASQERFGLSLTLAKLDQDHLTVKGEGSFEALMNWLSSVQETYRLSVLRMTLVRKQDAVVTVDLVLAPAQ